MIDTSFQILIPFKRASPFDVTRGLTVTNQSPRNQSHMITVFQVMIMLKSQTTNSLRIPTN